MMKAQSKIKDNSATSVLGICFYSNYYGAVTVPAALMYMLISNVCNRLQPRHVPICPDWSLKANR